MSIRGVAGAAAAGGTWRAIIRLLIIVAVASEPAWAAKASGKDSVAVQEAEGVPVSRPRQAPASAPASQGAGHASSQPASQPAATQARGADITPAAIEAAKTRVQAADNLSEADKKQILGLYDQALGLIKVASDWQTQVDKLQKDAEEVAGKLDEANARLAQPVEDLTPHLPKDATLAQVEKLCQGAADLDQAARVDLRLLIRDQQTGQDRSQEIATRQAAILEQITQISEDISKLAGAGELEQAQRVRLRAQSRALRRESKAIDLQHQYDVARQPLLTAQIDLATRYQKATDSALSRWKQLLEEQKAAELERSVTQARQQLLARQQSRPELREIAQRNQLLMQQQLDLRRTVEAIKQSIPSREELDETRRRVSDNQHAMADRIDTAGLTQAISALLQRQRAQLPDVPQHQRNHRRLEAEISKAQLDLIDLEDERAPLTDIDAQVRQTLSGIRPVVTGQDREALDKELHDLLRTKRKHLDDLMREYDAASRSWIEIQSQEKLLIDATRAYIAFIQEHVLWVRSSRPIQFGTIQHTWEAAAWLARPSSWAEAGAAFGADISTNPLVLPVGVAAIAGLFVTRRRLRLRLRILNDMASKGQTYAFFQTLEAMGITILLAAPGAALLWLAGSRLSTAVTNSDFPGALAAGLRSGAILLLVLELVRQICRKHGLGQTHLHWPAESMQLLRDNLAWVVPISLPLVVVMAAIDWQTNGDYKDSLGRLAFMAGAIVLAVLARRLLHPRRALIATYLSRHPDSRVERLRYLWYSAVIAIPAAMALAAAMGYTYTAVQVTGRILATAGLVFGVLIIKALLLRLLFVARRRLAIESARKRKASEGRQPAAVVDGQAAGKGPVVEKAAAIAAEPGVDLAAVDAQTRQLVRIAVLVGLALGLWAIWVDVLPALGILDRVHLWSTMLEGEKYTITLGGACVAVLIMAMAVAAARNVPGLLEITFLQLMPLEPGARYAINAISRYTIIVLGLVIACGKLGIGWSKVQWLAAAMTVGLGFGLQEIFANFISGLIILFERPIRVGDIVTVRDISGTVSKIRIRATTIVSWDRKELIVPNKEFITGQVVNWTLSDPILRMTISVGVAPGADADEVQKILLRAAEENCHVLENPKPTAFFIGFHDNALQFQLRVFVPSPEVCMTVQHELGKSINVALRQAGIEGSFVQGVA